MQTFATKVIRNETSRSNIDTKINEYPLKAVNKILNKEIIEVHVNISLGCLIHRDYWLSLLEQQHYTESSSSSLKIHIW